MPDYAEIAFEDDSVLFLRGYPKLAKVEYQAVQVVFLPALRGLHGSYFFIVQRILLRRCSICALSSPGFWGTIEEGVCFAFLCCAMLFYAMLCVPDVTF